MVKRRFQIRELVTLYRHHPDFRDFFVEGQRDKDFYEYFLRKVAPISKTQFFKIQDVDVPFDVLQKYELSDNSAKNRVIALALELSELLLANQATPATCIAEADFDYLFGDMYDCHLLIYTDYTSLEMYAFTTETIGKLLSTVASGVHLAANTIVNSLSPVLVDLFLVRATTLDLALGIKWLPPKGKRFSINDNGAIDFDLRSFVGDYLRKNGMFDKEAVFISRFDELKRRISGDVRKYIRGHDFVELLGRYLYNFQKKLRYLTKADNMLGCILTCLESSDLCNETLFAAIAEQVS